MPEIATIKDMRQRVVYDVLDRWEIHGSRPSDPPYEAFRMQNLWRMAGDIVDALDAKDMIKPERAHHCGELRPEWPQTCKNCGCFGTAHKGACSGTSCKCDYFA